MDTISKFQFEIQNLSYMILSKKKNKVKYFSDIINTIVFTMNYKIKKRKNIHKVL